MDEFENTGKLELLIDNQSKMAIPGGLYMKRGRKDYIGAWPAITGTLLFHDAHAPAVRESICACFSAYEAVAKEHLTWLWREDPKDGKDSLPYREAKPMREMMSKLTEHDAVSVAARV